MVSQRQRLARKRFRNANPEIFPPQQPSQSSNTKKKRKPKTTFKRKKPLKQSSSEGNTTHKTFRKHPLRIPGMKPGDSCFICKGQDHIAKDCPRKSEWEKNKTCLLCRQRGHTMKRCHRKSDDMGDKLCYNCGENGHSLFKCPKPLKNGGTAFASCFVCNQQGHLSKDCPKNSRGMYPKGGCCKICGEVTHLAKDCPQKDMKKSKTFSQEPQYGNFAKPQVTKFRSGDELDDDFNTIVEEDKTVRSTTSDVSGKKKRHKVINFVG